MLSILQATLKPLSFVSLRATATLMNVEPMCRPSKGKRCMYSNASEVPFQEPVFTSIQPQDAHPTTTLPTMQPKRELRRFHERRFQFRMGVLGVVISAVFFVAGFFAPAWMYNEGLWMEACFDGFCYISDAPIWLEAVRVMECLALVSILLCLVLEIYQDFCKTASLEDNKAVELCASAAGLFGLIGVTVYGSRTYGMSPFLLQWGFALTTASSILVFICAFVIADSRNKQQTALSNDFICPIVGTSNHSQTVVPLDLTSDHVHDTIPFENPSSQQKLGTTRDKFSKAD